MRVLFINTVYGQGSTGRIVADLGKMLEENGHEFKVAFGRGDKGSDPHCYRIGNDLDMYIHAGLSRITDRAGFYSKTATRKLVEYIKSYNPDIIHLHNLHGYYLNIEILFQYLAKEYKGRVIWTLHDCWAFTGHCVHFTYAKCDKWKTGCESCPQRREYPASWLQDRSALNYADKARLFTSVKSLEIITVSQWLKSVVLLSFLKNANVECIYNGVDTARFHPVPNKVKKELGFENERMILLVSDGWNERKGYSTVLDIAKIAPANWHFVMIGVTKKQLRSLPDNITGFERIWNQDKLIEFYTAADVFFNPSREETFGLVTAEALSCGTPTVVMRSTANPELIEEPGAGAIYEPDTAAEDVLKYLQDAIELKSKQKIQTSYTIQRFLNNYRILYGVDEG